MNCNKITVLMGGISAEREISLRTGTAVCAALERLGYKAFAVDVTSKKPPIPPETDFVFIALHGTYGEDGGVQSYLEQLGLPYTGTGVEGSRTAFNKILSKRAFERCGVLTPPWQELRNLDEFTMDGALVIKPPAQGSSVGVHMVTERKDAAEIIRQELEHQQTLLVEKRIFGRELTVAILDEKSLPIIEIRPHSGIYDYTSKYTKGMTEYLCPAPLHGSVAQKVMQMAEAAHRAVGAEVYSRVDIILDSENNPWVLEVNTIPGMTETSLLPKAAAARGIQFDELCDRILKTSLKIRHIPA
jgi:D-alanine-D-alanine ligase